jgi:hypothetical protein
MAKFTAGAGALDDLFTEGGGGGEGYDFAKMPIKVRINSLDNIIKYRAYGIYKEVDTFVAENPSTYNAKGFPQSNLTPWDKASEHYSQEAFDAEKKGATEKQVKDLRDMAYKFRGKERYLVGAIDLKTGAPVVLDLSRNQAQAVVTILKKNEKKLDKKAFEIEKSGTGTNTVVSTSPLDLDDLSGKELEAFEKAAEIGIDAEKMYGALYEADEKTQIDLLKDAKFDISLIGLEASERPSAHSEDPFAPGGGPIEISDEDLPF